MNQFNFHNIEKQIIKEIHKPDFFNTFYVSIDKIARILNAIVETNGDDWASKVLDDEGKPILTPEQQKQFTEMVQPYINNILRFFNKEVIYTGGTIPVTGLPTVPTTPNLAIPTVPNPVTGLATVPAIPTVPGIPAVPTIPTVPAIPTVPDMNASPKVISEGIYDTVIERIKEANKFMDTLSLVRTINDMPDVPIFGVPVSARLIVNIVYLILDIARVVTVSSNDNIISRSILSVLLAIYEVLNGNWKKGIVSMFGIMSKEAVYIGEYIKIFITLWSTLNNRIGENAINGTFPFIKSILVGTAIKILQISAPLNARKTIFTEFSKIKGAPEYEIKDWEDLNNIQGSLLTLEQVCKPEFQKSIGDLDPISKMILNLLDMPTGDCKNPKYSERCPQLCPTKTTTVDSAKEWKTWWETPLGKAEVKEGKAEKKAEKKAEVKEEPVKEEPVKEEPVKEEPLKAEPVKVEAEEKKS